MRGADSPVGSGNSQSRARSIRFICLVLIVAVLFASSFLSLRTPVAQTNQDAATLLVDTLFRTRALYSARPAPDSPPHPEYQKRLSTLIRDLDRLAVISPTPRTIRRLAITEYALGVPEWRSSLLRLRTIPVTGPTFDTERELALWRSILDGQIPSSEVQDYEKRLNDLNLGWYHHLALEALYRNAGMPAEAKRQVEAANSSTSRMFGTLIIGILSALTVLFLGVSQAATAMRRNRSPWDEFQLSPIADKQMGLRPITREQSDALYSAFVIYLATFAAIRLIMTQIVGKFASNLLANLSPEGTVALQLALGVVSVVPAMAWLWWKGRSNGLHLSQLGLISKKPGQDALWGVGGYIAALPLMYLATVISTWLFGGVQSPPHPVLAELAVTHGPLYLALMFAQVAVLPPLVEELMFRGVFFRALGTRMTMPAAVVVSSLLFAVLHPQLPLGFLGIFILGVIFNLLYIRRGTLWSSIIAHALNNGVIYFLLVMLISE